MKKTFLLIAIFHISAFLYSQQSWQPLHVEDTTQPVSILPISYDTLILGAKTYGVYPHGGIYRSIDSGESWQFYEIAYFTWRVYTLELSENDVIYAGTNWGIYKSINWGENWDSLIITKKNCLCLELLSPSTIFAGCQEYLLRSTNNGLVWDTCLILNQNTYINSILAVSDSLIYLAATSYTSTDGGLYVTYDGGDNWSRIGLIMYNIQSLAISPNDELYAGCWYSGLYKSEDHGFNWENVLPDKDAVSVITRGNEVFVGCAKQSYLSSGVFYSGDNGETWEDRTHNIANKDMVQIEFSHDDYLHTLSRYELLSLGTPLYRSMNPVVGVQNKNMMERKILIYPNPTGSFLNINFSDSFCDNCAPLKVYLYNTSGEIVRYESIQNWPENIVLKFNVSQNKPGLYILKLSCGDQSLSKKILIQ